MLESLIAPLSKENFLEHVWPKRPYAVHDLGESIQELTSLDFLKSTEALLNAWPSVVQVHLPDVSDESSAIDATPADARKLFANKMALLFNHAEKISPVLNDRLHTLRKELGLPHSTHARCMVYATPDGKGTAPHFDQNVNFVVQLCGTKKWSLAANQSVQNPTQRFTMGQALDPELATYIENPFATQMPDDADEIILKPGSVLFVPRGFWHQTEASGEALALNFTFSQPTWIDLLILALRSRLSLSAEWRELADGVSDPERRDVSVEKFDLLLSELVFDLPHWQAVDILAATEGLT